MALVVVVGLPCSGRSQRVDALSEYFRKRLHEVPALTDVVTRTEGRARAAYLSAVRRSLNKRTIVIADGGAGLNIKGYRYELWCATREMGLCCATLYVACTPELSSKWNEAQLCDAPSDAYTATCLSELHARFEEPTPDARWHRPLFVTTAREAADGTLETSSTPLDELWTAVKQGGVKAPKAVTTAPRTSVDNSLELLDTVTQEVLAALAEHRAVAGDALGARIRLILPRFSQRVELAFPASCTLPTPARLQSLRRQFVRIYASKAGTTAHLALGGGDERAGAQRIAQLFADWLQEALAA
ncbi:kti12, chromatin associated [Malassezia sp. CBS 17886]|nr:kti12, chromatin associated [Malassezia sp. CBS 17886]